MEGRKGGAFVVNTVSFLRHCVCMDEQAKAAMKIAMWEGTIIESNNMQ